MIALYHETTEGKRVRVADATDPEAAATYVKLMAKKWLHTKPGRTAKVFGMLATFAYSDGTAFGMLYGEPMPVPACEPDKQPRRI